MPKCREFEDNKKRLEAEVDAVTQTFDAFQLCSEDGAPARPVSEDDLMAFAIRNDDRKKQLLGIRYYRRLLCEDNNPHVQKIIDKGLVPYFVEALKADDSQLLQLEAAWALTNVSAGSCEETRVVIENGALPLLINFTTKQSIDLKEQALWAIGNIAAEKSFLKALLEKGALDRVLCVLEKEKQDRRLERIGTWALANFCRYGAEAIRLTSEYTERISRLLCLLLRSADREVLSDAAWAIASFTTPDWGMQRTKEHLVQNGVLRLLAEILIGTDRATLQYPISKACAQIMSGPESFAVEFLSTGDILGKIKKLLSPRTNRKTLSNILWLVQNIVANKFRVACKVFQTGIIPRVVDLVISGPYDIKVEAGAVLINLFYVTDLPVGALDALIGADTIRALCSMLTWKAHQTVEDALQCLEKVLIESGRPTAQKYYNLSTSDECYMSESISKKEKKRVRVKHQGSSSSRFNAVAQRVCNAGGRETLLMLTDHEFRRIKHLAVALLTRYFDTNDLSSLETSDEEPIEVIEMADEDGLPEDDGSENSLGARDEMALCDDLNKVFSAWGSTTASAD